jgi:hypothetical protein
MFSGFHLVKFHLKDMKHGRWLLLQEVLVVVLGKVAGQYVPFAVMKPHVPRWYFIRANGIVPVMDVRRIYYDIRRNGPRSV